MCQAYIDEPKKEENLVPLSDLVDMERAIDARDKTINELREKNEDLKKRLTSTAGTQETKADYETLKEPVLSIIKFSLKL